MKLVFLISLIYATSVFFSTAGDHHTCNSELPEGPRKHEKFPLFAVVTLTSKIIIIA
jgi:hypothetical protein